MLDNKFAHTIELRSSQLFWYGPYSGGDSVAAANIRYIRNHFPDEENIGWFELIEPGMTDGIAFNVDAMSDELAEVVRACEEDYPAADDNLVSEVEAEWLEEAVKSWAAYDTAMNLELDDWDERYMRKVVLDVVWEDRGRWDHPEGDGMFIAVNDEKYLKAVRDHLEYDKFVGVWVDETYTADGACFALLDRLARLDWLCEGELVKLRALRERFFGDGIWFSYNRDELRQMVRNNVDLVEFHENYIEVR